MGDTGSLVLGFVIAVLCIKLIQLNSGHASPIIPHVPVFVLSIVAIPVFDTLRVLSLRIWHGKSPFTPDKNHIHNLLTNNGWSHTFTSKIICAVHAGVLTIGYFLKDLSQIGGLFLLLIIMLTTVVLFQHLKVPRPLSNSIPVNPLEN